MRFAAHVKHSAGLVSNKHSPKALHRPVAPPMGEHRMAKRPIYGRSDSLDDRGTGLGWMEWHSDPARRLRPLAELLPGTPWHFRRWWSG